MKKIILTVPQPCHEDWNKMNPEEKGRFCNNCQKTVIDFTGMSDRQMVEFFKKPAGSLCGRFQMDQLNRNIEIPRKRIPWLKYFFQFSLPAFLITMKANAQGKLVVKDSSRIEKKLDCKVEDKVVALTGVLGMVGFGNNLEQKAALVSGTVTDASGDPIPGATIIVKGTNNGVVSDSIGRFQLNVSSGAPLIISAIGFQSQEVKINNDQLKIELKAVLQSALSGEVVIVGSYSVKKKPIPLIDQIKDSVFRSFSIYPNPVTNNSSYRIYMKKFHKGEYHIDLVNSADAVITTKRMVVVNRKHIEEGHVPDIAAGTYFIRITNKETGKIYSEKIMIRN